MWYIDVLAVFIEFPVLHILCIGLFKYLL